MGLQLRDELANSTREAIEALVDLWAVVKHYGPGPHPGTGTSQDVHGSGAPAGAVATRETYLQSLHEGWDRKEPLIEAWREQNPDLIAQSTEVLEEYGSESITVWLGEPGDKVRFIIAPDGRIFVVDDHDEPALDMRKKALTGKITGSTALAKLHPDDSKYSNPNKHIRDAWLELEEQFNPENIGGAAYPKIDMVNMGFVRGTVVYGEAYEYTELNLMLSTPVGPHVSRTLKEFTDVHADDEVRFDINFDPYRYVGQDMRELKAIIRRSEEEIEERHYGPGPHPGTGTSQDVHGSGDGAAAVDTGLPGWTPITYDDMPDRMKTFDIIEDAGAWGIYEGEIHSTASKDHTWLARAVTGDENATSDIFEVRGMAGRYRGVPVIVVYLTGESEVNYGFPEQWLPDAQENMDLALKHWDDIVLDMAFGGEEPFLYVWDGTGVYLEKPSASKYFEIRHYGPGPHPGTGTSQDVHGEEASGILKWQDENIEHIPKKMGRNVPEGMDYRPGRWLGLHSEGMGDVFREFAKFHDYGGRVSWSYIEEKLGRLEDDMARERDNEFIFEGELSSEDDARRQEMRRLWESFPGELSPQLEAAKHLNLRLLERDETGVILAIRDVRSFKDWEPTLRHYGPGVHPGTGTSQDVHGNGGPGAQKVKMTPTSRKQSGLGEFRIDRPAPSENNSIVFDDEELRAKGYSEEVIEQQREWYFANVSAAIIKMEDEMDIEIRGMEVTNSIMDLAERQAGPLVMGHPTRREAFMGRLREDTDEWLGGYYKGIVWLDDNHQGELISGPEDIDFRLTVHHEVGHFLTGRDGRARFSADYVISMSDGTYTPSEAYNTGAKAFYGSDSQVIEDEYRADLIASYPVLHQEWIRGFLPAMTEQDKRNQENIVSSLIDESEFIAGLIGKSERDFNDDEILVFFPKAGEIRGVPRSAINNLPKDAVILSEIFKK